MPPHLLLHLEAPLMSFGGASVDNRGITRTWPARSMIVGLIANAFGWERADADRLQALQSSLRHASRCDVEPSPLRDFQTVDLGQEHLLDTGWTTAGLRADRAGGTASTGTHIRQRDYLADGAFAVAVHIAPDTGGLTIESASSAILRPARPLFLGRKACPPASRVHAGLVEALSPLAALLDTTLCPIHPRRGHTAQGVRLVWDDDDPAGLDLKGQLEIVTDGRDWLNQIHVGERRIRVGRLSLRNGILSRT